MKPSHKPKLEAPLGSSSHGFIWCQLHTPKQFVFSCYNSSACPREKKCCSRISERMAAHDFANGWQGSLRLTATEPTPPRSPSLAATARDGIVVFSGGSAANNLVDVFNAVREAKKSALSYVIPISDNGGSSSELIRVFGGPGKYHYHIRSDQKAER